MSEGPEPDPGEVPPAELDGARRPVLVALVVIAGVLAGIVVALLVADRDPAGPSDQAVLAALDVRLAATPDAAPCVFGNLVAAGVLGTDLRRRVVDASDRLDGVAAFATAVERCRGGTPPSQTTVPTTGGVDATAGLPPAIAACVVGALGGTPPTSLDPATDPSVAVCAHAELASFLRAGAEIDEPTAQCAAGAVIDELGIGRVLALLAGAPPTPDVTAGVQAALATC